MSSPSNSPSLPGTVVLAPATADAGRDVATIRSRKLSLLAQLQSESAKKSGCTPEELLAQWPTNPRTDRDAASLIFQDFCRRREQDPNTNIKEYQERFPEHKDTLATLVQQDAFLKSISAPSESRGSSPHFSLPEVGDKLFGFRFLHELGRGSFARVFLATQDDLASRPVVLKVSNLAGDEPQTMAMLQHTHIVPIYSVHEDKRAGLRAVCMPYFGGASLSAVLKEAGVGRLAVRSGSELVRALSAVQTPIPPTGPAGAQPTIAGDPKVLTLLAGYQYPQAAAWIVARLAEGLQHSHRRGVLHRDIKPSNILLGMDGQPMLLDFNLAQVTRGAQVRIMLGGTINYMAPEHLRALAVRDLALARKVDHRADIYSLGMVLFEMLVGRSRSTHSGQLCAAACCVIAAMAVEHNKVSPVAASNRCPTLPGTWKVSSASAWPQIQPIAMHRRTT